MSHLRLLSDPADAALADAFDPIRFDNYAGDLTMPGCQEPCCDPISQPIGYRLGVARLEWQISGADLVPPLAAIVLVMAVCAAVWRAVGGGS